MADPGNSPETLTLLQYALGLGTVVGSAFAVFFGVKSKMSRPDEPRERALSGPALEIYMDGPLIQALTELKKITAAVERIAISGQSIASLREEFAEKLSKNRHDANDKIHEYTVQFEKDSAELENRVRDTEQLAAVLNERVSNLHGRMTRRP